MPVKDKILNGYSKAYIISSKKKLLLLLLFDVFFLRELRFLLEGRAMLNNRFHNILKREIITHDNKSKTGPQDGQRT